jgi:hypothetical protein
MAGANNNKKMLLTGRRGWMCGCGAGLTVTVVDGCS